MKLPQNGLTICRELSRRVGVPAELFFVHIFRWQQHVHIFAILEKEYFEKDSAMLPSKWRPVQADSASLRTSQSSEFHPGKIFWNDYTTFTHLIVDNVFKIDSRRRMHFLEEGLIEDVGNTAKKINFTNKTR